MIFLFRKEIKKWNNLWWVIIASLVLGGISAMFMGKTDKADISIASVNGQGVSLKEFHQTFAEMKSSFDDLAMYWGISADKLIKMMGMQDMSSSAMSQCVQNILVDDLVNEFSMNIDEESLQEALAKTVSRRFIDPSGKVNVAAYQNYLSRLHMSIADYEERKESEFKRGMFAKFMLESSHVPHYVIEDVVAERGSKKSFSIMPLLFETFLDKANEEQVSEEELKKFFKEKRELYRVNEKRKVKYITATPEEYKEKVSIDDDLIERFYERNKTSMYRIPPKVKVRSILIKAAKEASPEVAAEARIKAGKLLEKIKAAPETFADVAKAHSHDRETADKGGLTDFFGRGTRDPEFEKVAFLRLKEPGEISKVVRTDRGFEIIKLEDRIAATAKPLADVRQDVIEALKERQSLMVLKRDFNAVMRTSKDDKEIFEKFVQANELSVRETDWLTEDDAQGGELLDTIARSMFAGDRASSYGYLVHRGQHVLFKQTEKEDSYIPEFEKVADRVKQNWYERKAEELQVAAVKKLRVELFLPDATLEKTASAQGYKVVTTSLLEKGDQIDDLKESGSLLSEAFTLNDASQLLVHKHKSDYYMVKFKDGEAAEEASSADDVAKEAEMQKNAAKQRHFNGFIASLQRNARIEIREDILQKGM